jgi:hypothetical protein
LGTKDLGNVTFGDRDLGFLFISRYPLASTTKWIEENEKEVLAWDFADTDRAIYLTKELKVVAI